MGFVSNAETADKVGERLFIHAWEMARRIEQIEAANRERLAENWTTTAQDGGGR